MALPNGGIRTVHDYKMESCGSWGVQKMPVEDMMFPRGNQILYFEPFHYTMRC